MIAEPDAHLMRLGDGARLHASDEGGDGRCSTPGQYEGDDAAVVLDEWRAGTNATAQIVSLRHACAPRPAAKNPNRQTS